MLEICFFIRDTECPEGPNRARGKGVDDERKIRSAMPAQHGHVVILDILQFFKPEEQDTLLRLATRRVLTACPSEPAVGWHTV